MTKGAATAAAGLAFAMAGGASHGQDRATRAQVQQQDAMAQIPRCARSVGTLSITDGDSDGWRQYNLAPPQKLLKVIVMRSGCFNLLDRGAGMNAAQRERELAYGGELQGGSNVGKGQIKAADYVLVAEVAAQNKDASGGGLGAGLGGIVGGRFGAVLGGVHVSKQEANTVLSLTNVRTSETVATEEGYAAKNNVGFGVGGGYGFGGAVGGGYEDTDIGRTVTQAFINAYVKLVSDVGGASAQAPRQAFVTTGTANLRRSPSEASSIVRALPPRSPVYPTGAKEGMWWEVQDANGNAGWVQNANLAPAG